VSESEATRARGLEAGLVVVVEVVDASVKELVLVWPLVWPLRGLEGVERLDGGGGLALDALNARAPPLLLPPPVLPPELLLLFAGLVGTLRDSKGPVLKTESPLSLTGSSWRRCCCCYCCDCLG